MPRTAGVSSSVETLLRRRRPRPRTVARCSCLVPMMLRTSLTVTVCLLDVLSAISILLRLTEDFFDRLAALRGNVAGSRRVRQCVERGAHHVVRVARAQALGDGLGDPDVFEHRAYRAVSNYSGTSGRRRHQHLVRAVLATDVVVDRT